MSEQTQRISEDGELSGGKPEIQTRKNIKPAAAVGAGAMAGVGAVAIDAYGLQKTSDAPETEVSAEEVTAETPADSTAASSVAADTTTTTPETPANLAEPAVATTQTQPEPAQDPNASDSTQAAVAVTEIPDHIQIANVPDNLSFEDAFKVSRESMGPGALFEWHGHLYHTSHPGEYAALPEDMKVLFAELWVANEHNAIDAVIPEEGEIAIVQLTDQPAGDGSDPTVQDESIDPGDAQGPVTEVDSTETDSTESVEQQDDLAYTSEDFDNNFDGADEWVNPDDVA